MVAKREDADGTQIGCRPEASVVSQKVCVVLEKLMAEHGIPNAFRMDNGPEFIALAVRGLCHRCGINAAYIAPGKPWQNGYAESFHSRLPVQYLDGEAFWGVRDARVGLSSYRRYFNTECLHSSLGYLTPTEYAASFFQSQYENSEVAVTARLVSPAGT